MTLLLRLQPHEAAVWQLDKQTVVNWLTLAGWDGWQNEAGYYALFHEQQRIHIWINKTTTIGTTVQTHMQSPSKRPKDWKPYRLDKMPLGTIRKFMARILMERERPGGAIQ